MDVKLNFFACQNLFSLQKMDSHVIWSWSHKTRALSGAAIIQLYTFKETHHTHQTNHDWTWKGRQRFRKGRSQEAQEGAS